jgi:hypothetical protein
VSKTDFQNGFAAGYTVGASTGAPGGSSVTEEYVAQQLEKFKQDEISYEEIYKYDAEQLSGITYNTVPMFRCESSIIPVSGSSAKYCVCYEFFLAITKKSDDGGSTYLVDSPLVVDAYDTGYITIRSTDKIVDFGIVVDGDFAFLKQLAPDLVDGEVVLRFDTYVGQHWISDVGTLQSCISFYVPDEDIANLLKEELDPVLVENVSTFILKYKHSPNIREIDAEYIGG